MCPLRWNTRNLTRRALWLLLLGVVNNASRDLISHASRCVHFHCFATARISPHACACIEHACTAALNVASTRARLQFVLIHVQPDVFPYAHGPAALVHLFHGVLTLSPTGLDYLMHGTTTSSGYCCFPLGKLGQVACPTVACLRTTMVNFQLPVSAKMVKQ